MLAYNYTGTHRIQNKNIISVSTVLPGTVIASCHISTNQGHESILITGCLAVITSNNRSEPPVYKMIHLPSSHDPAIAHFLNATINGLNSDNNYRISLFETLGSLHLPVKFPAATESFQLSNTSQYSMIQGTP